VFRLACQKLIPLGIPAALHIDDTAFFRVFMPKWFAGKPQRSHCGLSLLEVKPKIFLGVWMAVPLVETNKTSGFV
jgi:hypothetical protein